MQDTTQARETNKRRVEASAAPATADYLYDRFSPKLLLADMRFRRGSLEPGDRLPDAPVLTTNGTEIGLRALAADRPLALVTGSLSCPMTASAYPSLRELEERHGDRVQFVLVNVREAHPGEAIVQPRTIEEKLAHAWALRQASGADWPVLVDDVAGTLHRRLDAKPNSLHLFDASGELVFRAIFATDTAVEAAVAAVAAGEAPTRATARQLFRPMLKAAGYIHEVLRTAGRRAYADVLFSAPPMAMLGLLSNALPWLPRGRRGFGVAAVAASVAAVAAAIAGVWLW